jgi:hypothetical protein
MFHQGHAHASGISEVNVVCTSPIHIGAMHVLGVVGLLSWFVGGGWRGSLELPRPLVIGVVSTVHVQRAIGEAALRSAIFWFFFRSFIVASGSPSDTSGTPGRKLCRPEPQEPQRDTLNLKLIMAASIRLELFRSDWCTIFDLMCGFQGDESLRLHASSHRPWWALRHRS